jgi:hypothetical protein
MNMSNKNTVTESGDITGYKTTTSNLNEFFNKILLPQEMKKFAKVLSLAVKVTWHPDANQPILTFEDEKSGKTVDFSTVKSLAGFRQFTSSVVKKIDQDTASVEKIRLLNKTIELVQVEPSEIKTKNSGLMMTLGKMCDRVNDNMEEFEKIPEGNLKEVRIAILEIANAMKICITEAMKLCVTQNEYKMEVFEKTMEELKMPRWLINKFGKGRIEPDKFNEIMDFINPKNYMNGMAYTLAEMCDDDFLAANKVFMDPNHDYVEQILLICSKFKKVKGRDVKATLENAIGKLMIPLPSMRTRLEMFNVSKDNYVGKNIPDIIGKDPNGLVKINLNLMYGFTYEWKCFENYQANNMQLDTYMEFLGFKLDEDTAPTKTNLYDNAEEELDIDPNILIDKTSSAESQCQIMEAILFNIGMAFNTDLRVEMCDLVTAQVKGASDVALENLMAKLDAVIEEDLDKTKELKEENKDPEKDPGLLEIKAKEKDLEDAIAKRMVELKKTPPKKIDPIMVRIKKKFKIGDKPTILTKDNWNTKVPKEKSEEIKKLFTGRSKKKDKDESMALITEPNKATKLFLDKIENEFSSGAELAQEIKKWLGTTFAFRDDFMEVAAQAVYGSLTNASFDEEDPKEI